MYSGSMLLLLLLLLPPPGYAYPHAVFVGHREWSGS
jgi:hypothetical protein